MLIMKFVFHALLSGSVLLGANSTNNSSLSACNKNNETQNLAMRKPASQSSAISEDEASRAVDGNINPSYDAGSCASTDWRLGLFPHWWRVDLEQAVIVTHVVIYNRVDDCHCEGFLKDFSVDAGTISLDGSENYTECYFHTGQFNNSYVNVSCSRPVCGRFVQIMKQRKDQTPLTLCEVEVYGSFPICTHDYSAILDECPASAKITDLGHTTNWSVRERIDEVSTYTQSPHNTKKNEVVAFSLISSVTTKSDIGTMTTEQQSVPDALRGRTSQHSLISTAANDVIIQENKNHTMYPQTSPATEIVTSMYTESLYNTMKNEVVAVSLISSVSTKSDVGTVTTRQQSTPNVLPGRASQSTLISTAGNDVIIQEGTKHTMNPQTSQAIEIVTSTYIESPNTKKNGVGAFSLISLVSTKPDGTITTKQESMSDLIREYTSQSTLISTATNDGITQEGTNPTMYPQTSQAVEVTTSSSVSPAKYPLCQCRCIRNVEKNMSAYLALKHRTEKLTKELVENLSIDKKTTTRYMRKLRSVAVDCPTAFSMGFVGVTFLILVGILLIANDIATVVIAEKQKQSVKPEGISDNP